MGQRLQPQAPLIAPQITVRNATKKAGGSTNNGRDSAGRRLGIKVWPGTVAKAGGIIVRQRGKKVGKSYALLRLFILFYLISCSRNSSHLVHQFLVGNNVGMGNDHTIFALAAGRVRMERSTKNRKRNYVHVDIEG